MAPIFTGSRFGFGRGAAVASASGFTATGGTITTSGDFTIHTFTSPGSFQVIGDQTRSAYYMVIGGGGSGSFAGGGAGGALIGKGFSITPGSYTVDVGNGGTGTSSGAGNSGQDSNFYLNGSSHPSPTYLKGVGGGGGAGPGANGSNGGSGGGAYSVSGTSRTGGTGTSGQGFAGGDAVSGPGSPYNEAASGGGGAGGSGGKSLSANVQYGTQAGNGGQGFKYAITGSVQGYASGGGGSNNMPVPDGGSTNLGYAPPYGGGTPGQLPSASSSPNATANTGGGGGGRGGSGNSANGGSGIVVIRYLTNASSSSVGSWSATGGTVTTPGNGYRYHAFTTVGLSTFTVTTCPVSATIELLVVGAGGGANGYRCSGGGGGGLVYYGPQPTTSTAGASYPITSGSYNVIVGGGNASNPGDSSSFDTVIAYGGGAGVQNPQGFSGGSGSGVGVLWYSGFYTGIESPPLGANGVSGQGNRGGGVVSVSGGGGITGGGGGAGAVGGNGSGSTGGNGGAGLQFPAFTGPLIGVPALNPLNGYYAGGGAGAAGPSNFGFVGGSGGAGGGASGNAAGTTNSGGGAASGYPQSNTTPVSGGPGIVVLRYPYP